MTDVSDPIGTVDRSSLDAAVASLCCRFGEPELEARRRGGIHSLLQSSRAFALALEHFARKAGPHARGEHSTAGMQEDADAMARALADWSYAVNSAAENHQEYHGRLNASVGGAIVAPFVSLREGDSPASSP